VGGKWLSDQKGGTIEEHRVKASSSQAAG